MNYITTKELAEKYGVTVQTVSLWRLKGLPHFNFSSRNNLYDPQLVDEWFKNFKKVGR